MPRLRERNTGSVVNVPDDKVAQVLSLGYYDVVEDKATKKPTAKKPSK